MLHYHETYKSRPLNVSNQEPIGNYSGTNYISGYTSIGYTPRKKISREDSRYEQNRDKYRFVKEKSWNLVEGLKTTVVIQPLGQNDSTTRFIDAQKLSQSPEQPKKRYGLSGISRGGRIKVREGSYLLHQLYGRGLGFYTLTCPYTTEPLIYEFNRNINLILKRYFEMIKRAIPVDSRYLYVSVLELQESRYLEGKGFAMHVHYLMPCYFPGTTRFLFSADELRAFWYRACNNCIGGEPDVSAAIDAVVVRKSASGYISKYMSKGGRLQSEVAAVAPCQIPKQWWSMSSLMRKVLKRSTLSLHPETAEHLFWHCNSTANYQCFTVAHQCYARIGGREICVGVAGYITPEWMSALWKLQRIDDCRVFIATHKKDSTLDKKNTAS